MEVEKAARDLEKLTITPSGETVPAPPPLPEPPAKVPKVEWAKYSKRVVIKKILGRADGGVGLYGECVVVGGWVKSGREQSKSSVAFLEVSDSTCTPNVQGRVPLCLRSLMRLVAGNNPNSNHNLNPPATSTPSSSPSKPNNGGVAQQPQNGGNVRPEPTPTRTVSGTAILLLNDGSFTTSLQVVVESSVISPLSQVTAPGTSILVQGVLRKPQSSASRHKIELKVEKILQLGATDLNKYPIAKSRLPLDFLRNYIHLRPRTNTFSAVARLRNALAYATHTFFQNHGFLYVHTPIITTAPISSLENAFQVTTLFSEADRTESQVMDPSLSDIEEMRNALKQKTEKVMQLRRTNSNRATVQAAIEDMEKTQALLSHMESNLRIRADKHGNIDYSKDFFSRQAYLTVSGQFHVESYACALSSVYTFGPAFKASSSSSSRHLAEFWMIEPEMAFADLEDDMNCAEDYLKFICQWLLDNCKDDMKFMSNQFDKNAMERLKVVASTPFHRITYEEALAILSKDEAKFSKKPERGVDLSAEHERYLTEQVFRKPVIVYNYPKDMKSFYVKLNNDNTAAAMEVLVPRVGQLISGSQREEIYDVLENRFNELGLPKEPYEWYLELRKYGTVKHSGFGMAFEKMVLFVTGLDSVRDTIPFPRYRGYGNP